MEKLKLVQAEKNPAERNVESSLPKLLDEFKPPETPSVRPEQEAAVASDKKEAQDLLEKLKAAAPAVTPAPAELTPHEMKMNTERATTGGRIFAARAEARNESRKWWEKLFKRGEVSPEDMAREDAEKTYVEINNLKRNPSVYGGGQSGPVYNSMAEAKRRGASESQLSQVAAESDNIYNSAARHGKGFEEYDAKSNVRDVEWEKKIRREQGLPTDILDRDIEFAKAQKWEQEQRKREEGKSGEGRKAA